MARLTSLRTTLRRYFTRAGISLDRSLTILLAAKIKSGAAVLLCLGTLTGSAGALGNWILASAPQTERDSSNHSQIANDTPAPRKQLTDIYGDALPKGAVKRLGTIRFRHAQHIEAVAYSPDGKWIASGGDDNTVRIWDRATGAELIRFEGHRDDVHFVTFTPDGKHVISSSGLRSHGNEKRDPSTLKWEAPTGKVALRFPPNEWNLAMTALALSPDGTKLAACLSPSLHIFDVATGNLLHKHPLEGAAVYRMRFTPDNRRLALVAEGQGVEMIDVVTGNQIWLNKVQKGNPTIFEPSLQGLAISPDGNRLAVTISRSERARVLDAATGVEIFDFENGPEALVYSHDGKHILGRGGIFDAATGRRTAELQRKMIWLFDLALSPDGKQVAKAGSGTLEFWDASSGETQSQPTGALGSVNQIALAPDAHSVLTASMFDLENGVRQWNLDSCKQMAAHAGWPGSAFAVSPGIDSFAFGDFSKSLVFRKTIGTWAELKSLPGVGTAMQTLAFTRDGKKLLATANAKPGEAFLEGGPILLWDLESGKGPIRLGTIAGGARTGAVSPDNRYFAAGGWDGTIYLWDIVEGREVHKLFGQKGNICTLAFSPDSRFVTGTPGSKTGLSCIGRDHRIRVWDLVTGQVVKTLEAPVSGSWSIAWSPDGKCIASGGEDGLVRLWDVATNQQRTCLTGHNGPVTSLAFTADARHLLSGSTDTTVLVWALADLPGSNSQGPGK
jgi:WD40 repeat protein